MNSSNRISKIIQELWESHDTEQNPDEEEQPAVSVIPNANGLTLYIYPADRLTEPDRKAIWEALSVALIETVARELPGLNARVITPTTFPDGSVAEGHIQYTYPLPDTPEAAAIWWDEIARVCPMVNTAMMFHLDDYYFNKRVGKRTDPATRIERRKREIEKQRRNSTPPLHRRGLTQ